MKTEFVTNTATLCVFDEEALKHRLEDTADWWSDPEEELIEVNEGNVLFVALGRDGRYTLVIHTESYVGDEEVLKAKIKCVSGHLFIGPGEDVSGDGVGPNSKAGGVFLDVGPATYTVSVLRKGTSEIDVYLEHMEGDAANSFEEPLSLPF
jgi:hypothetical protein